MWLFLGISSPAKVLLLTAWGPPPSPLPPSPPTLPAFEPAATRAGGIEEKGGPGGKKLEPASQLRSLSLPPSDKWH